ncbi:helix-turn-helix domain-containing protein [Micromonospora sp. NPDC051925]|uniref:helix-turn-helix domain-containing protein n=1 Tax=Micromonospora sp. NPDC051925 TaxID=3364288 RepID=UPI0037C999EF
MSAMAAAPTVRRRRLGMALRRLRDNAEMTLEQASEAAGVSGSHVSRIERAQVAAGVKVIKALLDAYGADEQTSAELLEIAGEAGRRGWWHRYSRGNLIPPEYAALIQFEAAASEIRTFEPMIIPGLLQTSAYAQARLTSGPVRLTADRIEARVQVRAERQRILDRDDPPVVSVVIDEAVIRRKVGGADVMRQQLLHVAALAERPNVDVQVVPFSEGAYAGTSPFVILSFEGEGDVIYLETMAGNIYPESETAYYRDTFARIQQDALSKDRSVDLIRKAAEEFK